MFQLFDKALTHTGTYFDVTMSVANGILASGHISPFSTDIPPKTVFGEHIGASLYVGLKHLYALICFGQSSLSFH